MKIKIALLQMTSTFDFKVNIQYIEEMAKEVSKNNTKYLFLPEVFYSMSDGNTVTEYLVEEQNQHYKNIQKIAIDNSIYLLGGTAITSEKGKIFNRVYNFDPSGNNLGSYDKVHLFSCDYQGQCINEGKIYSTGNALEVLNINSLYIGFAVCFDLRFPRLANIYRDRGANILSFSSAFTTKTGKDHWHVLLRARAIENQCFVIAANQYGIHQSGIRTYGHSLVVDPWGDIILDAEDKLGLFFTEIDLSLVEQVRKKIIVKPIKDSDYL